MDKLNLKERTAIELRYLGNTVKVISEKINTPEQTIRGWFQNGGKLYEELNSYTEEMNQKRQKNLEEKISVSDDEFFVLTTNIIRHIGKNLQKRKIPVVNSKGEAVADENGKPQFIEIDPITEFSVNDLKTVWQIQRIMKGLPVNYEKQDITQTNLDNQMIMKELGLTAEDFKDENIESTRQRIAKYLRTR